MTEKINRPKAAAVMTRTHFCAPLKRASAADGTAEAAAPSSAFSASSASSQPTSASPAAQWVGNSSLVADVHVSAGKQHTSVHAKAALSRLLDVLGDRRPALVQGDPGYGNEAC